MRIAIVDDAAVMRAFVASVARDLGHDVVAVYASVADARAGLATALPDVVLVDGRIGLGPVAQRSERTNEAELAEVVRALDAACGHGTSGAREPCTERDRVAILALAALDDRATLGAAFAAGAAGVVLRPVSHGGLASALEAIRASGDRASAT